MKNKRITEGSNPRSKNENHAENETVLAFAGRLQITHPFILNAILIGIFLFCFASQWDSSQMPQWIRLIIYCCTAAVSRAEISPFGMCLLAFHHQKRIPETFHAIINARQFDLIGIAEKWHHRQTEIATKKWQIHAGNVFTVDDDFCGHILCSISKLIAIFFIHLFFLTRQGSHSQVRWWEAYQSRASEFELN